MPSISPMWVNQTLNPWAVTLIDSSGNAVNLTSATLSVLITNTVTGASFTGGGSWNITNATAGQATYSWAASDTATAGQYTLQVTATYPGGGVQMWQPIPWIVKADGAL